MGLVGRIAVVGAALCLWAAPTGAQTPAPNFTEEQIDEMHCIYDAWSEDDVYLVADNYFDPVEDELVDVEALFDASGDTCATLYEWDADLQSLAETIALHTAVVDVVLLDMAGAGLASEDAVLDAWWDMTADDRGRFLDDDWFDDAPLKARAKAILLARGVADDALMIESGMAVLEASSIVAAAMLDWSGLAAS